MIGTIYSGQVYNGWFILRRKESNDFPERWLGYRHGKVTSDDTASGLQSIIDQRVAEGRYV